MGDEMGFQHKDDEGSLSSGTNTNPNATYPFYACGWDPLTQNQGFGAYPGVLQNPGMSSNSRLLSDSSFVEMAPKLVSLGSGCVSEMVGSFGLPDTSWPNKEANGVEEGDMAVSTEGKPIAPIKKDDSLERSQVAREEEQSIGANLCGKQTKDNSNGAKKDDYIHVRARKGQATNSHSLAERVRREKISERMRLLQDIVPGCNKITGKAVMLDEIINYVQSLQQQVEFLSMKLATVNPELNIDIKRVLSKDVHSHSGFGPAQPFPHGIFYGASPSISNATQHFPPLLETVLDPELQNLFQMRYDLSFGTNGN